jgi:hypothetical protein
MGRKRTKQRRIDSMTFKHLETSTFVVAYSLGQNAPRYYKHP